ncbi:MAG TPA: electron transfer flavoprotein subunit alpha/FixB family protein [Pyrinomonadaceae bacterium]|nr:electron transfer flavoprotein subunit alpha/FixB family protein [Pyrinomonadaceae bacterium]
MNDVVICLLSPAGFDRAAQGLAGAGRRLAEQLGSQLTAIVLSQQSPAIAQEVATVVDKVIVVVDGGEYQPEPALSALTETCRQLSPATVLLGNDTYSQEVTPRLAYRLGGAAVGDVVEITVHEQALHVARQVYGGKAQATIELKRTPAVLWTRSRSFAPANRLSEPGNITELSLEIPIDTRTKIVERKRESQNEQRLEEARVIVSGGRGIGGPEPFNEELKPLAELMGAQLAASRAACDAGWVPPTLQVGQTGKKVTPDLYLAIAITGASQHMAGISEAKNIAAINTDPDAPIFKHCRFGIVEDYRKVVPLLRQKLIAIQNSQT